MAASATSLCCVGRPTNIELLSPAEHLDLLVLAAQRYGLDREALEAAARAALAAPDRQLVLGVGSRAGPGELWDEQPAADSGKRTL
jgi:hypothetical protein